MKISLLSIVAWFSFIFTGFETAQALRIDFDDLKPGQIYCRSCYTVAPGPLPGPIRTDGIKIGIRDLKFSYGGAVQVVTLPPNSKGIRPHALNIDRMHLDFDFGSDVTNLKIDIEELHRLQGVDAETGLQGGPGDDIGTGNVWLSINGVIRHATSIAAFYGTTLGGVQIRPNIIEHSIGPLALSPAIRGLAFVGLITQFSIGGDNLLLRSITADRAGVPEPTTMLLFGAGMIGVCLRKRQTTSAAGMLLK